MKRWLNNWELKKEYLANLRKQFGVDNEQMNQTITALRQMECCESDKGKVLPLVAKLGEVY
jgi:hypothetical protein